MQSINALYRVCGRHEVDSQTIVCESVGGIYGPHYMIKERRMAALPVVIQIQ